MYNLPGITKDQAYDQVRKEFYRLRQEEEVERRIALEEARMVGAYFGKSRTQVGMELEDGQFEKWKKWAESENEKILAERSQGAVPVVSQDEEPSLATEEQLNTATEKPAAVGL